MKKLLLVLYLVCLQSSLIQANGIFLWEYRENGSLSCCLHFANADICNPDVPCTRTIHVDLVGIYDYIGRILTMEKSGNFPFYELLKNAQGFIQRANAISLGYRYNYFVSHFKFHHELAILEAQSAKGDRSKSSSSSISTNKETDKSKQDDATLKYLMKLGLAKQIRK